MLACQPRPIFDFFPTKNSSFLKFKELVKRHVTENIFAIKQVNIVCRSLFFTQFILVLRIDFINGLFRIGLF